MRSLWPAALIALGTLPSSALAQEVRTEIGLLTCSVAESGGEAPAEGEQAPMGQGWDLLCSFRPSRNSPEEVYTGTLQTVGEQQQLAARGVMMWVVKGTTGPEPSPGQLQQTYSADVAGPPTQAAMLVGDADRTIALQSLAETGAAPSAGRGRRSSMILTVDLKLRSSPA